MALSLTLEFLNADKTYGTPNYVVHNLRCHLTRPHGKYHPDGPQRCERIEVKVMAPGKSDLRLLAWYVNRTVKSGRVLAVLPATSRSASDTKVEIVFTDAVCFQLEEEYDVATYDCRMLTLSFEAEKVTIQEVV